MGAVMIAVLNSEFSWFTIMVDLVIVSAGHAGSEWKPLEESTNLWAFMMRINWKRKVIVDTVIEGGQLSGIWVVEDILFN